MNTVGQVPTGHLTNALPMVVETARLVWLLDRRFARGFSPRVGPASTTASRGGRGVWQGPGLMLGLRTSRAADSVCRGAIRLCSAQSGGRR